MKAPAVVLQKYPLPLTAEKVAVFGVVSQSTVHVLPNPVCVAPDAKATVPPHLPIVTVEPQTTTVVPAPDPTVVVAPHLLTMSVPHWF